MSNPYLKQNKIVIVNPATLLPRADGEIGEIWLDNPSVSPGYWQNQEATQEYLRTTCDQHEEKYLRTGDLGLFMKVSLCNRRMKDLIIYPR